MEMKCWVGMLDGVNWAMQSDQHNKVESLSRVDWTWIEGSDCYLNSGAYWRTLTKADWS